MRMRLIECVVASAEKAAPVAEAMATEGKRPRTTPFLLSSTVR